MKLLSLRDQLLITSRVLLKVGQVLIPLLLEGRTLLCPLHHLKQQGRRLVTFKIAVAFLFGLGAQADVSL